MNEGRAKGWRKITIKDLEKEYGNLEEIIPKLVNEGGQTYAAFQLGTTATTISKWLKAHGYIQKTEWIKQANWQAVS